MTSKKWVIQWNFNVQKWKATTNHKAIPESIPGWGSHSFTHDDDSFFWTPIVSCSSKENSDMRRIYLLNHFSTINGMQLLVWKCLAPTNFKPPQSLSNKPPPLSYPHGPAARIWAKIKGERTWTIFSWTRFIDFFFKTGWREPKATLAEMRPCAYKVTAFYDQTLR